MRAFQVQTRFLFDLVRQVRRLGVVLLRVYNVSFFLAWPSSTKQQTSQSFFNFIKIHHLYLKQSHMPKASQDLSLFLGVSDQTTPEDWGGSKGLLD